MLPLRPPAPPTGVAGPTPCYGVPYFVLRVCALLYLYFVVLVLCCTLLYLVVFCTLLYFV